MTSHATRINIYQSEIQHLENEVESLITTKAALVIQMKEVRLALRIRQERLTNLRNLCAPIASLPNELLSAVFEACPSACRSEFAQSVSRVSRHWRETAIATTFLWSHIQLVGPYKQPTYCDRLKLFIRRSRSHALDIAIDLCRDDDDGDDIDGGDDIDNVLAQLEVVIPEVSRWRTFKFQGDYLGDVWQIFLPLRHLCAPVLEDFDVMMCPVDDDGKDDTDLLIFQGGAPVLSRISIDGIQANSCLPPISSLTSLRLIDPPIALDISQFLEIITTNLTDITLSGEVVDCIQLYDLAANGWFTELTSLRSLSITFYPADDNLKSLLSTVRSPSLQKMSIIFSHGYYAATPSSMLQALKLPPYPALRSLTLSHIDCSGFIAVFDFTQLPALTHIKFVDCLYIMAFLGILLPASNEENNDRWPSLQDVSFQHLGDAELVPFCDLISHRMACGRPIKTVTFGRHAAKTLSADRLQWLQERLQVDLPSNFRPTATG